MFQKQLEDSRVGMRTVFVSFLAILSVSLLTESTQAQAGDFGLKIEPGVAMPLTAPQTERFSLGGGQSVKAMFGLTPFLDIGPSVSFVALPPAESMTEFGTAWMVGGGFRVKRPHTAAPESSGLKASSPWIDADAFYTRTGLLDRPGFSVGMGLAVPIGKSRSVWFGPFVRYVQIVQGEGANFDNRDAMLLNVGLSLEVGPGIPPAPVAVALGEERIVHRDTVSCPDRDGDTIPDNIDRCPDVKGVMENGGCPAYEKVIVKHDKLELREKLYFAWNEATLEPASYAVLDEVARALNDNKGFRVQVEGHASSEGADDHNQTLSEQRAETVLAYLVSKGISKDRLVSKGFSSSVPVDTNATAEGRENNRRVEFVVNFIILEDGSAK